MEKVTLETYFGKFDVLKEWLDNYINEHYEGHEEVHDVPSYLDYYNWDDASDIYDEAADNPEIVSNEIERTTIDKLSSDALLSEAIRRWVDPDKPIADWQLREVKEGVEHQIIELLSWV